GPPVPLPWKCVPAPVREHVLPTVRSPLYREARVFCGFSESFRTCLHEMRGDDRVCRYTGMILPPAHGSLSTGCSGHSAVTFVSWGMIRRVHPNTARGTQKRIPSS